jgi:Family of unknown function (DUF5681)
MAKKIRKPRCNYTVGYRRPPTSSQFQPGQSGNPNGRPKGARNASSNARDALERPINVRVKGTWRKTTVRKAAYRRLAEKAVAGDVKALDYLLSLESKERPADLDDADSERSAAKDLEILQDFFNRRCAGSPHVEPSVDPDRDPGNSKRRSK